MSSQVQELVYGNTAEVLIWDAPEGRPASVTDVQIWPIDYGDDSTEETAPGAGAIETNPNTTFASASGYSQSDPTALNLTSGTGVTVGRTYLATNTIGEKEWVTTKAVTGNTGYAAAPLKNDFAATSTFVSTRITSLINAIWIADDDKITDGSYLSPGYRVRWTYVVGTTTYVHDSYFDVVRYKWVHSVNQADMRTYVPGWDDRLPTDHREDGGARLIDRASINVKLDMKRAGIEARLLRQAEVRDELVMAASWILIERPGSDGRLEAVANYNRLMDGLLRITRKAPLSVDTSGAGYPTKARGLWSK